MTEQECLARMVPPGRRRPGKFREGVIQVHLTRACDMACFHCTQGSNFGGRTEFMPPKHFAAAVESLRGYFGVVGVFGGNPATSPHFEECCAILRKSWVPREQRGLWCNNPITLEKAKEMRETFDPRVSNLNVHLSRRAWDLFKQGWPESMPFGLHEDSRHSPVFAAMKDVLLVRCENCLGTGNDPALVDCGSCGGAGKVYDEARAWELISGCDINQHWSAMIGVFRGQLRAWFCEVAGAQAMLHQDEPDYPDIGLDPTRDYSGAGHTSRRWWELPMNHWFAAQVRKHCHECSVPLRGYGELAQAAEGVEQVSATHAAVAKPKRRGRQVEIVERLEQLGTGRLKMMTRYMQNAKL